MVEADRKQTGVRSSDADASDNGSVFELIFLMADFNDNVAIVTGARRGIGASEVRLLVAPGARVLAIRRS
jgi:3-oxoacyl-ACP reductase-like protein